VVEKVENLGVGGKSQSEINERSLLIKILKYPGKKRMKKTRKSRLIKN
jgi:hypothetical protein